MLTAADGADGMPAADFRLLQSEGGEGPTVFDEVIFWFGYFVGWIPWLLLFLSAWKRNLLPCPWFDHMFGEKENPAGLRGQVKFLVLPGALSLFMNTVLWITMLPASIEWTTFPRFCIIPRTFRGLLGVHQTCWHHFGFLHFANNNFCVWTLGPLILTYGRRTFASSIFFINFVGGFVLWLCGPERSCIAGYSGVLFGWFGVLTLALFLECPPKWWRVILLLIVAFFLGGNFYSEVAGGDNEDGTSWHGHAFGFFAGLIYSGLRFRRRWFQFEGIEDRVRPVGSDTSAGQAFCRLLSEFRTSLWASGVDVWDLVRCRPPREEPEGAKSKPAPPPTSTPAAETVGNASAPEAGFFGGTAAFFGGPPAGGSAGNSR